MCHFSGRQLQQTITVAIVLLFGCTAIVAAANKKEELLGTWEVVDVQVGGKSTNDSSTKRGDVLRLASDELIAINPYTGSVSWRYPIVYDANVIPMQISISGKDSTPSGVDVSINLHGIVEVVGDRMRICLGHSDFTKLPKDFSTVEGDGLTLLVLKRKVEPIKPLNKQ